MWVNIGQWREKNFEKRRLCHLKGSKSCMEEYGRNGMGEYFRGAGISRGI
jgi:hypothetical protein